MLLFYLHHIADRVQFNCGKTEKSTTNFFKTKWNSFRARKRHSETNSSPESIRIENACEFPLFQIALNAITITLFIAFPGRAFLRMNVHIERFRFDAKMHKCENDSVKCNRNSMAVKMASRQNAWNKKKNKKAKKKKWDRKSLKWQETQNRTQFPHANQSLIIDKWRIYS